MTDGLFSIDGTKIRRAFVQSQVQILFRACSKKMSHPVFLRKRQSGSFNPQF